MNRITNSGKAKGDLGGSLENRMCFPMEVLQEIAKLCADQVAVSIRKSADEYLEDGLKFREVITMADRWKWYSDRTVRSRVIRLLHTTIGRAM